MVPRYWFCLLHCQDLEKTKMTQIPNWIIFVFFALEIYCFLFDDILSVLLSPKLLLRLNFNSYLPNKVLSMYIPDSRLVVD